MNQTSDLVKIIELARELNIPEENATYQYGLLMGINQKKAYERAVEAMKEYASSSRITHNK